jgi:hypothetical protein
MRLAQTLEDLGKFLRTVVDTSKSSKISVDGPVYFNRAEAIFQSGRPDDSRTNASKHNERCAPKSEVKIQPQAHFFVNRC